jgi:hypothetical protein
MTRCELLEMRLFSLVYAMIGEFRKRNPDGARIAKMLRLYQRLMQSLGTEKTREYAHKLFRGNK